MESVGTGRLFQFAVEMAMRSRERFALSPPPMARNPASRAGAFPAPHSFQDATSPRSGAMRPPQDRSKPPSAENQGALEGTKPPHAGRRATGHNGS